MLPLNESTIEGLKEIGAFLGLIGNDNRKRVKKWIVEGLPARLVAGRWYANKFELQTWYENTFKGSVQNG